MVFIWPDQANLARERITNRQTDEDKSRRELFNLFEHSAGENSRSDRTEFEEALAVIGKHEGIDFQFHSEQEFDDLNKLLCHVLDASGGCARQIRLDSVDKWWTNVSGAMLAFRKDSGQPVALVPNRLGYFCEISGGRKTRITAKRAKLLEKFSVAFLSASTT